MTRLDATSDPSMEDILASIRKIIAEDPPGSRANPPPPANLGRPVSSATAAPQSSHRTAGRESYFPSLAKPDSVAAPAQPAPEPYPAAQPQKPAPAPFGRDTFFGKAASKPLASEPSPAARIEPRIEPTETAIQTTDIKSVAATPSVDDQLSELLGDMPPTAMASPQEAVSAMAAAEAGSVSSAIAEGANPLEIRQGFTVSRDGFIPGETEPPPAERSPFDFDLGPSPFVAIGTPSSDATGQGASLSSAEPAASTEKASLAFDFGSVVPMREADDASTQPTSASIADMASTKMEQEASAIAETAEPSVSATLAPAQAPSPTEPVARFVPVNAGITRKTVERDIIEVAERQSAAVVQAQARPATEEDRAASTSIATIDAAHSRTMEETVAELLRPMLRSWLAENMPRIVERALRRELNEQLGEQKQTAAQ